MKRIVFSFLLSIFCLGQLLAEEYAVVLLNGEHQALSLGQYFEHQALVYEFALLNQTEDAISQLTIATSCGCTSAISESQNLAVGQATKVTITSDLTGKRGELVKHLTLNYLQQGQVREQTLDVRFSVSADVSAHKSKNINDVLFNDKCGQCHFLPAANLRGEALFKAVCSFCHGEHGQGASARGFNEIGYMTQLNFDHIKKVIADGDIRGLMPGFHQRNGGPLADDQIDSLVDFFEQKQQQILRFKKSNSPNDP